MYYGSVPWQFFRRSLATHVFWLCPVDLDYVKAFMGSAQLSYEFIVLYEIESVVETDVCTINIKPMKPTNIQQTHI